MTLSELVNSVKSKPWVITYVTSGKGYKNRGVFELAFDKKNNLQSIDYSKNPMKNFSHISTLKQTVDGFERLEVIFKFGKDIKDPHTMTMNFYDQNEGEANFDFKAVDGGNASQHGIGGGR